MNPTLDDPARVAIPIIVLFVAFAVGADIMEYQVSHIEDTKLEMCEKHFEGEFTSEKVNGKLVCVQDSEIYRPEVQLLNGVLHYLKILIPVLAFILAIAALRVVSSSLSTRRGESP